MRGKVLEINDEGLLDNENPYKAIQIDRPHGRIIDEKELLDKIKRGRYSEDINQVIYLVGAEDIANAPTILDEEGK